MKKVMLILSVLLLSCGQSNSTNDGVGASSSTTELNNIIEYNNQMIKYMEETGKEIERFSDEFDDVHQMVSSKTKKNFFFATSFRGMGANVNGRFNEISLINPKGELPDAIKNDLTSVVKLTSESYDKVKKASEDFKSYYDNEDYKDDDWAKGAELENTMKSAVTDYYLNREKAYDILTPIAEEAETEMLKDHPLKESILAAKEDIEIAEDIVSAVYEEDVHLDVVSSKYDELETNMEKHINLTPELLVEYTKTDSYKDFYEYIEKYLGVVRKAKRDNKITESEAESIGSAYEDLIYHYNQFM